jgi:hypothetical protein
MADTKKRSAILTRLFIHESDKTPRPRAGLDVTEIVFKYADEQETRVPLAQFFGGTLPAPGVGRAAAAFGINTSAGNTIGTLERERDASGKLAEPDPADVKAAVEDRLETFAAGRWAAEEGSGGPGVGTRLLSLIKFREMSGKSADEAWKASKRQQLEEDPNFWKTLMSHDGFRAVHEGLVAERAAAKAKAASAKAAESKGSELNLD